LQIAGHALGSESRAASDAMMVDGTPGMTGYKLAQLVRRDGPLVFMKLIALTG
jgi:hypothetical protein